MDKLEGYCFKCKKKVPFKTAALTWTPKRRAVIKGQDAYGHNVSRLVSQADINQMRGSGLLGNLTGMDFGPLSKIPLLGALF